VLRAGGLSRYQIEPGAGLRPLRRGTFISACAQHLSRLLYFESRVSQPLWPQTRPSGYFWDARGRACGRDPRTAVCLGIARAPSRPVRPVPLYFERSIPKGGLVRLLVIYSFGRAQLVWSSTR
jgi:hypothetical protein